MHEWSDVRPRHGAGSSVLSQLISGVFLLQQTSGLIGISLVGMPDECLERRNLLSIYLLFFSIVFFFFFLLPPFPPSPLPVRQVSYVGNTSGEKSGGTASVCPYVS